MASLEELLSREGFRKGKRRQERRIPAVHSSSSLPPTSSHNPLYRDSGDDEDYTSIDAPAMDAKLSHQPRSIQLKNHQSCVPSVSLPLPPRPGRKPLNSNSLWSDAKKVEVFHRKHDNPSYDKEEEVPNVEEEEEEEEDDGPEDRASRDWRRKGRSGKKPDDERNQTASIPDLDDAAIQAVIAITTGYIRRFFHDDNYRAKLRQSCFSCIQPDEDKEGDLKDKLLTANFKESILAIEGSISKSPDPRALKKASLKLMEITGSVSTEMQDYLILETFNLRLSACAHLYLGLIFRFLRRNKESTKHLFQVFCESPELGRRVLLPALWDHLFRPHFKHLEVWYEQETGKRGSGSEKAAKMKMLDDKYHEVLDVGTRQFAVYYKNWLLGDNNTPELPSIWVPFEPPVEHPVQLDRTKVGHDMEAIKEEVETEENDDDEEGDVGDDGSHGIRRVEGLKWVDYGEEEHEIELQYKVTIDESAAEEDNQSVDHSLEEAKDPLSRFPIEDDIDIEEISPERHIEGNFNHDSFPPATSEWKDMEPFSLNQFKIPEEQIVHVEHSKIQLPPLENLNLHTSTLSAEHVKSRITIKADRVHGHEKKLNGFSSEDSGEFSVSALSTETMGSSEDFDQVSRFNSIPKEFICPLTGKMFNDPVTLETGQTFERWAITEWLRQGKALCPITGRALTYLSVPVTNFVLKRIIEVWRSENCRNILVFATQMAMSGDLNQDKKAEPALFIIEQLLISTNTEEQMANARHVVGFGGLELLLRRLEKGNLEEKTRVVSLLLICIKADGSCRNALVPKIKAESILQLLNSKQTNMRSITVSLMIELICYNRREVTSSFLSSLRTEEIVNTMHALLLFLQSSSNEERLLVSVLILNLDLMVEPTNYSIYREEAVDAITTALDLCSLDREPISNLQRPLLMLGGYFSFSGETQIENWLLNHAGFHENYTTSAPHEHDPEDESNEEEEWLRNMTRVLLRNGKRSFVETLSISLGSGKSELVRICLITSAWMSCGLSSSSPEFDTRGSALPSIIPPLKEIMKYNKDNKNRVLASLSLFNLSKISECRALLKTYAKEMIYPLKGLVKITWTAKKLHSSIFGDI